MAYISFQPSDHFNAKLYSGTGSSNAITGVGFQPDWLWIKKRNDTEDHVLIDAVRGASVYLKSNGTDANTSATSIFSSFDSDGFTVTGTSGKTNNSGGTFASWNWKANGSGSANSDGSISSTLSANTTSGFSIVKYTGGGANATVGHGLSSAPEMVIVKRLSGTGFQWMVYHKDVGNDRYLNLDDNGAQSGTSANYWNNTDPTSSVFSIGVDTAISGSGAEHIAYCFHSVKGHSKVGSYTGNGNADGAFIYTGFRPAMIIIKLYSTGAENWRIFDNKRIGYNPNNYKLYPSLTNAEGTSDLIDIYSNGFKPRSTSVEFNGSGNGYIYYAVAEHAIVSSNDIPATAR